MSEFIFRSVISPMGIRSRMEKIQHFARKNKRGNETKYRNKIWAMNI